MQKSINFNDVAIVSVKEMIMELTFGKSARMMQ